ncbi:MAG: response regulator [Alphaproteobacteria bacterium]|nr:response regulator [Alphaproteobacteria bacterium]
MKAPEYEEAKVTIIDPSRHMRSVLKQFLRNMGFHSFLESDNAADGLKQLIGEPADLVFVEYDLLPVNGVEFTRFVRHGKQAQIRTVPVVMVTTHTEAEVVTSAREAGVDAFLVKPLSGKNLHVHLERLEKVGRLPSSVVREQKSLRVKQAHLAVGDIDRILDEIGFKREHTVEAVRSTENRMLTDEEIASLFAGG